MNLNENSSFPIVIGWSAIESEIINNIVNPFFDSKSGGSAQKLDRLTTKKIMTDVCSRVRSPMFTRAGKAGVISTLKYMYYVIRVGILICIKDGKLIGFAPFANPDYINNWHEHLKFEIKDRIVDKRTGRTTFKKRTTASLNEYIRYKKTQLHSVRDVNPRTEEWAANAYFVNNAIRDDVWGQHSLPEFHSMIDEATKHRQIRDCIFFLNKRDYPVMRLDLREPYFFMWPRGAPEVSKELIEFGGSMTPVVSPYTNEAYADLPFPIAQDWIMAIAPDQYFHSQSAKLEWKDKRPTAFFRGSLTGRVDHSLNQRLMVAKLSNEWRGRQRTSWNGTQVPILDAGITSWNLSDKINQRGLVSFTNPKETKIRLSNRVPMDEAVNSYRYILNIDGHARPNRTGYLLASSSLMIMVESANVVGNITWIDRMLQPGVHYISVKADLTDLEDKIKWCIEHDEECIKIVKAANALANKLFNKEAIMDYVELTINAIANRTCS